MRPPALLPPARADGPLRCVRALRRVPHDERLLVADGGGTLLFRGTANWRDALAEARVGKRLVADGAGGVHRGFWDLYEAQVRARALEAVSTGRVHTLAGHSLGGVFAILCAHDMHRLGVPPPRAIYTYGAPRVGDARFARASARFPVRRVANAEDVVTRLPPLCHHVGAPLALDFDLGSIVLNHGLQGYEDALAARRAGAPWGPRWLPATPLQPRD